MVVSRMFQRGDTYSEKQHLPVCQILSKSSWKFSKVLHVMTNSLSIIYVKFSLSVRLTHWFVCFMMFLLYLSLYLPSVYNFMLVLLDEQTYVLILQTNILTYLQRWRRHQQHLSDQRGGVLQRRLPVGSSRHLPEHVQDRHHMVSVWRAEMWHEVRVVDLRLFWHRPTAQRRRLRPVQLHDQRRVGTPGYLPSTYSI